MPQTGEGEIHVLSLQHADAIELAKTLNEIVTGAGAGGRAGGRRRRAAGGGSAAPQGIFEGARQGERRQGDQLDRRHVVAARLRVAPLRHRRLDQPRRQVFIEAVIMDLHDRPRRTARRRPSTAATPFGAERRADASSTAVSTRSNTIVAVPTDPTSLQGFALGVRGPGIAGSQNLLGTGITIPAFGVLINALAQTDDTDVLSTPHILATDNVAAEINVGENIPLQTNVGGWRSAVSAAAARRRGGRARRARRPRRRSAASPRRARTSARRSRSCPT